METRPATLLESVRHALEIEIEAIAEGEFKEALKRIEQRKSEVISATVIRMQQQVIFNSAGQYIQITIRQEKNT